MSIHKKTSACNEQSPLWQYVPLEEFTTPRPTAQETVRKNFFGFFKKLLKFSKPHNDDIMRENLQKIPAQQCERVTPKLDWESTSSTLDTFFENWQTDQPSNQKPLSANRVQIIISAPHSGVADALTHWANTHKLTLVAPPSVDQILFDNDVWLDCLPAEPNDTILIVPSLEKCYLRHAAGLGLLRQLLSYILQQHCRCVIGCSSWAWVYLTDAINIGVLFPKQWTLQALGGPQLQQWFGQLGPSHESSKISFRQADTGAFVISPPSPSDSRTHDDQQATKNDKKKSTFLTDLAAHSRGNPGVAWSIWRNSLRREAEKKEAEKEATDSSSKEAAQENTIWVTPWHNVSLPYLHGLNGHRELFVLHTLLLHGKLSLKHLIELMPFSSFEIEQTVDYLKNLGVLELEEGGWQVTAIGYPATREALASAGYPLDCL